MRTPPTNFAIGLLFSLIVGFPAYGQRRPPTLVCKRSVLQTLKPMPELNYPCDEQANGWEEKILKLPARVAAIKSLILQLSSFSDAAWWAADPVDLGVCDFTHEARTLTAGQRRSFLGGDYLFWLFGNERIRLLLIPDPCYQTEYGGSNAFLLYRSGGKVNVSQVLDGYFSRADNSVGLAFAKLNGEDIIEVSTGSGGLNPSLTNYYFTIDPRTNQAVAKKLFKGDRGLTNEISSAMLMTGGGAAPLKVLRGQSMAPSFVIYVDDEHGKIDENGRTLSRKLLRWNGKLYH